MKGDLKGFEFGVFDWRMQAVRRQQTLSNFHGAFRAAGALAGYSTPVTYVAPGIHNLPPACNAKFLKNSGGFIFALCGV